VETATVTIHRATLFCALRQNYPRQRRVHRGAMSARSDKKGSKTCRQAGACNGQHMKHDCADRDIATRRGLRRLSPQPFMRPLPLQLRIRVSFTSSLFGDIVTTMADPGTYTRDVELDAAEAYIPNHTSMTGCLSQPFTWASVSLRHRARAQPCAPSIVRLAVPQSS
jgi:hypothetical protein